MLEDSSMISLKEGWKVSKETGPDVPVMLLRRASSFVLRYSVDEKRSWASTDWRATRLRA